MLAVCGSQNSGGDVLIVAMYLERRIRVVRSAPSVVDHGHKHISSSRIVNNIIDDDLY
jgi:NAD(P)H-hydrate repair Nnr-like enzyme with NAD(P)H-hydrate epimerase domain